MRRVMAVLSTALVLSLGLITLWGLFPGSPVASIAAALIQLVVIVGAVAVLVGLLNLLWVHLRRVLNGDPGWGYSLALFVSALAVILLVTVERLGVLPDFTLSGFLFNAVQVSVESALAGLLVFFLVYAAARLLRHRVTWSGVLFVIVLLVVLIGWLELPALGFFNGLSRWIRTVPAVAGGRGLLIGIALGVTTAGIRVLLGQDSSYRE
ncbi:MAG: hypothetical protein JXN59_15505 [Anaerolineae bacterium]|nr:hypothetical protein [Anaerolineae bacterium]